MAKPDTIKYPRNLSEYDKNPQRLLRAQILRRLKALRTEGVNALKPSLESEIKNVLDFLKRVPAIIKDPTTTLRTQRYDEIFDKEKNFSENTAPILLAAILDRLESNHVLFIKSRDEFESHSGQPSFLVSKTEDGSINLAECSDSYEGRKIEVNQTLERDKIIERVSPYLELYYIKEQILVLEWSSIKSLDKKSLLGNN